MADDHVALYIKIAKAVASIDSITKSKTVETKTYSYSYATLNDTLDAIKQAFGNQGLTVLQPLTTREGTLFVDTLIIDQGNGDFLHFSGPGIPAKGDPQAMGSAISYLRRYSLTSFASMNVEDDDGAQAHRAAANPGARTEAEVETRKLIAGLTKEEREFYVTDFKAEFNCGLSELEESRHGTALGFTKNWINSGETTDDQS